MEYWYEIYFECPRHKPAMIVSPVWLSMGPLHNIGPHVGLLGFHTVDLDKGMGSRLEGVCDVL